jgi:transcriptional regulator with XRE-family HTH domain
MIGALLRKQRGEVGMTQRALAEAIGISPRTLSAYEKGERPIPLPELEALISILGQTIEDYVDTEGPVGEWATTKRAFEQFQALPLDLREFIFAPQNEAYLRLAQQLREISVEKLRTLAEALLDLTL